MRVQRPGSPVCVVDDEVKDGETTQLVIDGRLSMPVKRFGTTREGLVKFVPYDGGACFLEVITRPEKP